MRSHQHALLGATRNDAETTTKVTDDTTAPAPRRDRFDGGSLEPGRQRQSSATAPNAAGTRSTPHVDTDRAYPPKRRRTRFVATPSLPISALRGSSLLAAATYRIETPWHRP